MGFRYLMLTDAGFGKSFPAGIASKVPSTTTGTMGTSSSTAKIAKNFLNSNSFLSRVLAPSGKMIRFCPFLSGTVDFCMEVLRFLLTLIRIVWEFCTMGRIYVVPNTISNAKTNVFFKTP